MVTRLALELAKAPRCGLCSHYPVVPTLSWFCPIYGKVRHRRSKPPAQAGLKLSALRHFICFTPYSEIAYEKYLELVRLARNNPEKRKARYSTPEAKTKRRIYQQRPDVRESVRLRNRRVRAADPEKHRAKVREYNRTHPDIRFIREIIWRYDPYFWIKRRFRYTPKSERQALLPFKTHIKADEWDEVQALIQVGILGNYGDLIPDETLRTR